MSSGALLILPDSNSATAPDPALASEAISWEEAARVCRRICVLRERGDVAAADKLRANTLAEIIAAKCLTTGAEVVNAKIESIFAIENERVANAVVVAELLAPLLELRLAAAPGPESSPRRSAERPAAAPAAPTRSSAIDIADFIDEMLAQERSPPAAAR